MSGTDVVPGVVLPPDSSGKIMADFPVEVATSTGPQIIHIPASVIVDASGREIGQQLVKSIQALDYYLRIIASSVEPKEEVTI